MRSSQFLLVCTWPAQECYKINIYKKDFFTMEMNEMKWINNKCFISLSLYCYQIIIIIMILLLLYYFIHSLPDNRSNKECTWPHVDLQQSLDCGSLLWKLTIFLLVLNEEKKNNNLKLLLLLWISASNTNNSSRKNKKK